MCVPPAADAQELAHGGKLPPLARYFPSKDLVAYVEFDGLDGHGASWQKTAAYRLLNETTTGAMYRAALPRIFTKLLGDPAVGSNNINIDINGRDLTDLMLYLFRRGFAVGINRAGGTDPPSCFAIVARGAGKGDVQPLFERVLRADATRHSGVKDVARPGGRTVHQLGAGGAPAGRGGPRVTTW